MLSVRRTEAARACFSRVVQIDPEHVAARSALARTRASAGEIPEAIHTYRVLRKDQPRLKVARSLEALGRVTEANAEYRHVLNASTVSESGHDWNAGFISGGLRGET
jgi:cytochrome c-type biogenesis protein CcmH/NrfG